ncbi:hypothetical protein FRC01_003058 [Tulasnella sp. 417]|nr:hypothetical protein FRC01_003058 [Tulasnella sp. 417]
MDPASSSAQDSSQADKKPVVIITIGMAGSGKTTFVQRINSYLHSIPSPSKRIRSIDPTSSTTSPKQSESGEASQSGTQDSTTENETDSPTPPYILNLDPAVTYMPFEANIDIRDTINYAEVMKQYNLGPNGGILTALNLFTTKFDQVLGIVEKRAETVDYVILDTPGQIEIFTWSASGAIITDAVAASFPTVVAYVIDTARTTAPATFMSNMLYACSILYKTKLPFILVFNKTDVQKHDFAVKWMTDFEAFQKALQTHGARNENTSGDGDPNYMDSLMHSMSLVLDEFYQHLKAVGVSSVTGDGMKEFFEAVEESREEYKRDYLAELQRLQAEKVGPRTMEQLDIDVISSVVLMLKESKLEAQKTDSLKRLMADLQMEEEERRKRGLPTERERFPDSDDDDANQEEMENENDGEDDLEQYVPRNYIDMRKARKITDPQMESDGSKWPRPG